MFAWRDRATRRALMRRNAGPNFSPLGAQQPGAGNSNRTRTPCKGGKKRTNSKVFQKPTEIKHSACIRHLGQWKKIGGKQRGQQSRCEEGLHPFALGGCKQ